MIPPHPLTNFEIQKYENKSGFNGVFSRDNLPKTIKNGAYVINLMNMQMCIGLLYFVEKLILFIPIVLVLNMFLKKWKNLLGIKT